MNDRQNTFFRMLAAVKVVADVFNTDWKNIPSFANPYGLLQTNVLLKLPGAAAQQQTSSKGVSLDKKASRKALSSHLISLAATIGAYAISKGNNTLRDAAHLVDSDLVLATEDELLGIETRISKLAADNLTPLEAFGITNARILALDADADDFAGWIGKPRAAIARRKEGSQQIDALETLGHDYLDAMDGQMILFKESAPDFYSQYFTARKLQPTGSRPRAIYISAQDIAGHVLPGVTVKIDVLNLTKVTSANGNCFVQHAAPGTYTGQATKHGYLPATVNINVNDGETAHVTVTMQPAG